MKLETSSDETDAEERPAKSQQCSSKNHIDHDYASSKRKPKRRAPISTKLLWQCTECLAEFPRRKDMLEHFKSHEQEAKPYKYDEEQEVYTCNTCSAEFQGKDEIEVHVTKNHAEQYTCEDCLEKFTDAYLFSCHMQQHSDDQVYRCPLCSYSIPRRSSILAHINQKHYYKFSYYCKTCGKGINNWIAFKEHENEHLGLRPFVCVVCDKAFIFSKYLLSHQLRNHTVGIEGKLHSKQCPGCLKIFVKKETLNKHVCTKPPSASLRRVKKHLCDVCGNGFSTKTKLRIHYRVHTGVKPYACSYCSKSFGRKPSLVTHERVHTGEKPYSCELCGKRFTQLAPLKIHVRGHTGERPYICQCCNKGFTSRGALNMHQKVCVGDTD